ncbi:MAG: NAD(P)-dependent alcohol dehydrogenase [Phycisphaerales bacterium]|nr:NAD(P)-dependent alcohol dehydrogenase [Phycisphaerales bacterium]
MGVMTMAAKSAGGMLERHEVDLGPLGDEQVEIAVTHCGICHSDLSMLDNDWGMSSYPLVAGHEAAGTIVAVGSKVHGRRVGERVGLGWFSGSCMSCLTCMSGDHNLCATAEATIVGRVGAFATRVRSHWAWAVPIPEGMDGAKVGPLFCGGITVFNPIIQCGITPLARVGVVGIGGLGHMALQFLNKWGCEVYAFTSSESKAKEARSLGAHHTVNSTSDADLAKVKGKLDFILVTVNVKLNWQAYIDALAPKGRLHIVGAVAEPIPVVAFPMIIGQKSLSASPVGSPANTTRMLDFAHRTGVSPIIETFAMSKVNEAIAHLKSGKARYRVVLENDLG